MSVSDRASHVYRYVYRYASDVQKGSKRTFRDRPAKRRSACKSALKVWLWIPWAPFWKAKRSKAPRVVPPRPALMGWVNGRCPVVTKSRPFIEIATYAKVLLNLLTCWSNLDILWHDYALILITSVNLDGSICSHFATWCDMSCICICICCISWQLHRRRFSGSWADDRKLHQDAYKVQHCVVEAPGFQQGTGHLSSPVITCHHNLHFAFPPWQQTELWSKQHADVIWCNCSWAVQCTERFISLMESDWTEFVTEDRATAETSIWHSLENKRENYPRNTIQKSHPREVCQAFACDFDSEVLWFGMTPVLWQPRPQRSGRLGLYWSQRLQEGCRHLLDLQRLQHTPTTWKWLWNGLRNGQLGHKNWLKFNMDFNGILVGGWATPLKNMSSSIGMIIATQYSWENAKFMATIHHQPVFLILQGCPVLRSMISTWLVIFHCFVSGWLSLPRNCSTFS